MNHQELRRSRWAELRHSCWVELAAVVDQLRDDWDAAA